MQSETIRTKKSNYSIDGIENTRQTARDPHQRGRSKIRINESITSLLCIRYLCTDCSDTAINSIISYLKALE